MATPGNDAHGRIHACPKPLWHVAQHCAANSKPSEKAKKESSQKVMVAIADNNPYAFRWLVRRDMPEVMAIENASFADPWTEEEYLRQLRQRNCIGSVIERTEDSKMVGVMIYELHQGRLELVNIAVHPHHRRQGVGTAMLNRLKEKLSQQARRSFDLKVGEQNLRAHLFFQACGMKATEVVRAPFRDSPNNQDGYRFVYQLNQTPSHKRFTV
jgi:[ribosomal protein S18]-alanine N-acetyltransferase